MVIGKDADDQLENIETIFNRLRKVNLKINLDNTLYENGGGVSR